MKNATLYAMIPPLSHPVLRVILLFFSFESQSVLLLSPLFILLTGKEKISPFSPDNRERERGRGKTRWISPLNAFGIQKKKKCHIQQGRIRVRSWFIRKNYQNLHSSYLYQGKSRTVTMNFENPYFIIYTLTQGSLEPHYIQGLHILLTYIKDKIDLVPRVIMNLEPFLRLLVLP